MTRKIISLNDAAWRVGSVPQKPFGDANDLTQVSEWLPAHVPGDVRLDLLAAAKIADPFVAMNNQASQWVDARDWWYTRDLELDLKGKRAFLVFEGIDYQSAVFFGGTQLGRHCGMFSHQVYELLPSRMHSSQLAVRIWGTDALPKMKLSTTQKVWQHVIQPLFSPPNEPFPDRYATLKCQMQFGWDFAPRLRTCGIWDDAYVVVTKSVFIEDVRVKLQAQNAKLQTARIEIVLSLDSTVGEQVRVECGIRGKNFACDAQKFVFNQRLVPGKQEHRLELELEDAREWEPWDRGDPNLYELELSVLGGADAQDEPLDSITATFGVRSIELRRDAAQQEPWTFVINGKREFIRGANWVPLDAIPGRLREVDYCSRLKQVRDANINFLRVWGGGLRDKRAFYDLCDELGILVWQEFPFSGATLDRFPSDEKFLGLVRKECGAIVRTLRHHPSVVVWCGGNEFNTRGNRAVVRTLRQVVESEDGTRPFKPASPYRDESHNWRVWHRYANVRDYKKDRTPFLSEFGLQSTPNVESLQKFLPQNALFPPNRTGDTVASNTVWQYHHAELNKLERYAKPSGRLDSLDAFVTASQRAQAAALQIAIEHMRRRKADGAAGVTVWQFNDCWPSISWSVVDYYGVPKSAYHALRRANSPVLASFDYPLDPRRGRTTVHGDLWIINDLRSSFTNARLAAFLNDTEIFSRRVDIAPDSAARIGALAVPLAQGDNRLRLKLSWGPAPLSENEYDLNYCDEGEIHPLVAAYVAIGNRLMR